MDELIRFWLRRLIPVVILAMVLLLGYGNLAFVAEAPAQTPFVARWIGLREWFTQGTSPYAPSVSEASQERIYGRPANPARGEDPQHFLYPPAVAVALGPFALLPLPTARAVWMTILQIGLVALPLVCALTFRWTMNGWLRVSGVALALFSYPGFLAVLHGDLSIIACLALMLSLALLHRRREAAAGWLAAASLVKPQLSVLLLVYLYVWGIRQRRWTLMGWMTTGVVVLFGLSTALLPTWPVDMARQVLDYAGTQTIRSTASLILGTPTQPYSGVTLIASAALLGYLFWEWRLSLGGGEQAMVWAAMLTLTVTIVLSPFSTIANQILLMPPLLLAVAVWHERLGPGREAALSVLLVVTILVTWAAGKGELDPAQASTIAIVLPPLFVGGALEWIRWWATRPPIVLEPAGVRAKE